MLSFAKLACVTLCLAAVLHVNAEPSFEELIDEVISSEASCPNNNCCLLGTLTGTYTNPVLDSIATLGIKLPKAQDGLTCNCGAAIQSRYSPCSGLPLLKDATYEAYSFDSALGLALGGYEFKLPTGLLPAMDVCMVTSACGGTVGFYQKNGPLKAEISEDMEMELKGVMLSASSEIEMTTSSGLWKGSVMGVSDPLTVRGQIYGHIKLTMDMMVGDFPMTIIVNGKVLFAMDTAKTERCFDTLLQATLGKGSLDFNDQNLPGFQITADASVYFKLEFSKYFTFKVSDIAGVTLTMGVNMQDIYGGQYARFTNGLYACVYQSLGLPDFIPLFNTLFPTVGWPKTLSQQCFFVNFNNFGFRMSSALIMFGTSLETAFSMDSTEAKFSVILKAWIFSAHAAVTVYTYSGVAEALIPLDCGDKSCDKAVADELSSTVNGMLHDAAKAYYSVADIFKAADLEEENVEDMLNDVEEGSSASQGWKKKKFKKSFKAATKAATSTTKTVVKAADTAVKSVVQAFSASGAFFRVSNIKTTGGLCDFRISMKMETGIKLCGKDYNTSQTISVKWDPATLLNDIKKAIPMPF